MRRVLVFVVTVVAVAAIAYWLATRQDRVEEEHYERQETELVVANLAHSPITLFKAGRTLDDTTRVDGFDGQRIWLAPGNYFLQSVQHGRIQYYPVPLTGYRCGPDEDGSYLVTIRPAPREFPPRLLSTLPEFVLIPSGTFLMGDRQNPREPHYVWVPGYFIAPFEVTNEEFRTFLGAEDGYHDDAHWTVEGRKWRMSMRSQASALLTPADEDYERFGKADLPVTWVTWFEANAFCKWLTRRFPGWLFTLPNDAEWEKAARGPDNLDYALSMSVSDAEASWYNWRKNPDAPTPLFGVSTTGNVFRTNRYGLYHMTGNVVEWTQSIDKPFNRDHPFVEDERNYDDARGKRTARGGSWYSAAISYLYIPYRDSFQPEHSTQDIGFRIVAKALP